MQEQLKQQNTKQPQELEGPNLIALTYLLLSLERHKTFLLTVFGQHSVSCVCNAVRSQNGRSFRPHHWGEDLEIGRWSSVLSQKLYLLLKLEFGSICGPGKLTTQ